LTGNVVVGRPPPWDDFMRYATATRSTAPPPAATEPARATISVVLTHACPIIRAGLRALLSQHAELAIARDDAPCQRAGHVVITDYARGVAAAQAPAGARILVLTTHDREGDVRRAIDRGVHGYLVQGCAPEEVLAAVRNLAAGRSHLGEAIRQRFAASLGRPSLTPRESDVLQLLFTGASDKLIARALGIGAGTVKCHVQHLLQKLDASARTQAVVVGIERGLIAAR
jgi:DNA-binding NarL/FixJ family response regulator